MFKKSTISLALVLSGFLALPSLGQWNVSGNDLSFPNNVGNAIMNNQDILLRSDSYHGLGYYGRPNQTKVWVSNENVAPNQRDIDGPVLYGWGGGALGSNQYGVRYTALQWDRNNNIILPAGKISAFGSSDNFAYNNSYIWGGNSNESVGRYSLSWRYEQGSASAFLSGYVGIKFFTSDALRMFISRDGKVGIGTSSPTEMLSVNGNIGAYGSNVSILNAVNPAFVLGVPDPNPANGRIYIGNLGIATTNNAYAFSATPGDLVLCTSNYKPSMGNLYLASGTPRKSIKFGTSNASGNWTDVRMEITHDGVVRIRNKIVVTSQGWADNVFDKTYKLSSLKETEDFIEKNHHLPNIPSEATLKETGIDPAEMLKLQMAKIEELTLHLIEQQKKIEALEAKLK